jgi:dipeptidyl aminopeptidase/acylaminoacyl peptidase
VLGTDLASQKTLPLAGIPSRARLSADGDIAATTSFTAGDSYAGTSFSTRTVISNLRTKAPDISLESMKLMHDGSQISPLDRNFWGVTFASDDDTFYATVAWGGHTWLSKGSIRENVITTLQSDAECPSLSPDGKTIVYKKRNGQPSGHWRLASYNVATGKETLLAETRNVDDQVDWLDNSHVLYGLPRSGSQAAIDDIYSVPADGSGSPSLLIPQAWSPAVVR